VPGVFNPPPTEVKVILEESVKTEEAPVPDAELLGAPTVRLYESDVVTVMSFLEYPAAAPTVLKLVSALPFPPAPIT
tara:strand:- start:136 stop:366 length:231 start_codon:yes stop_codon:yes gene_type:complete